MDNVLDTGARMTTTVAATGVEDACTTALEGRVRNITAATTESAAIVITNTTTRKTLLFFMFLPNFQYLDRVAVTRRFPPSLQLCRDNNGVRVHSIWQ